MIAIAIYHSFPRAKCTALALTSVALCSRATPHSSVATRSRCPVARYLSDEAPPTCDVSGRRTGSVNYFNLVKQYGFIVLDGVDRRQHESPEHAYVSAKDVVKEHPNARVRSDPRGRYPGPTAPSFCPGKNSRRGCEASKGVVR